MRERHQRSAARTILNRSCCVHTHLFPRICSALTPCIRDPSSSSCAGAPLHGRCDQAVRGQGRRVCVRHPGDGGRGPRGGPEHGRLANGRRRGLLQQIPSCRRPVQDCMWPLRLCLLFVHFILLRLSITAAVSVMSLVYSSVVCGYRPRAS